METAMIGYQKLVVGSQPLLHSAPLLPKRTTMVVFLIARDWVDACEGVASVTLHLALPLHHPTVAPD